MKNKNGNYTVYEPQDANAEPTRKAHMNAKKLHNNLLPNQTYWEWFRGIKPTETPSAETLVHNPLWKHGGGRKTRKYPKSRKSFRKGRKNFH